MGKVEKLELKHLSGYLPYGLKISHKEFLDYEFKGHIMVPAFYEGCGKEIGIITIINDSWSYPVKPLLRPLSDLTKEIEHNGERFVPVEKIISLLPFGEDYKSTISWRYVERTKETKFIIIESNVAKEIIIWLGSGIMSNQYWVINMLYEWHFDIHCLIESGLAIDMNTIK